ncbi:MAG TPA: zinc-binding dehydrogenase [Acidimicrobiales bacterium]|nr:zinc-binding dehydrogenase [Acidimicrobiales bacterium]
MRAVTISDGAVAVAEHPDPEPGVGEVLVRVRAAGVNNADLLQAKGFYPAPPGVPADIPGLELAGEVVAVGRDALRFSPGDRVMAVVAGGGQAEWAVVHERALMPVPEGLSWEEAGAIPEAYMTAHDALFTQCGLSMGERVCISGAAGGVGTAAVHLAAAAGARVVASVRNEALRGEVQALGASVVVAPEDFVGAGPFDVVLELIGGPNMAGNVEALAPGGRIVVIGVGGGASAEVNLLALMAKRARITASTLRARPLEQKADAARRMEAHVLPLFEEGRHRVPLVATYPLDEVAAAYERFAAGGKLGKIVLAP